MAPAALTGRHEFLGVAGVAQPPNAAFLASLQQEGPLRIREEHVLCTWLPGLPASGAGFKRFSFREFYYTFLELALFEDLPFPLLARPLWMGRFLRFLTAAGMPETAQQSLHHLRILASSFVAKLPADQRTVGAADTIDIAPTAPPAAGLGWVHSVTTFHLRNVEGLFPQVCQLSLLLPCCFIESGHTESIFARAQRLLAAAAGVAVLAVPVAEQADEVCLFLLRPRGLRCLGPSLLSLLAGTEAPSKRGKAKVQADGEKGGRLRGLVALKVK